MKILKNLLFAAFVLFALDSCVKPDDFEFHGVNEVKVQGMSRIDVSAEVENRSGHKLFITAADLTLKDNGRSVAEVILMDPVVVNKKTRGNVDVPLRLKINDPLRIYSVAKKLSSGDPSLTVSGKAVGRISMGRKKITFEDMPLSQFLATFGVDSKGLINLIDL